MGLPTATFATSLNAVIALGVHDTDTLSFGRPVALIGDATTIGPARLFVSSTHGSAREAISSLHADAINPLPRVLCDLNKGELAVLNYDPVVGVRAQRPLALTGDRAIGLDDLRDELGHFDD
jgi:hypothetical protein